MNIRSLENFYRLLNLKRNNYILGSIKQKHNINPVLTMSKRLLAGNNRTPSLDKKQKITSDELMEIDEILSQSDDWDSDDLMILDIKSSHKTSQNAKHKNNSSMMKEAEPIVNENLKNIGTISNIRKMHTESFMKENISELHDLANQILTAKPIMIDTPSKMGSIPQGAVQLSTPIKTEIRPDVIQIKSDISSDLDLSLIADLTNKNRKLKLSETDSSIRVAASQPISFLSGQSNSNVDMTRSHSDITIGDKQAPLSNKFSFATQIPSIFNMNDDNDVKKTLHLAPNTKVKVPIRLSVEQEQIIKMAEKGYNIFYTGSAGTGKSILLKELIKKLKTLYEKDHVAVTASTGLAACNIGGVTIHSYTGIGLGKGDGDMLYKKVRRSKKHLRRWQEMRALVIDEVSMLDGELLDKLNHVAKKIRKNHTPFGGIQVIFCGDFFQLPPVSKDPHNPTKFAFESTSWKEGVDITVMLKRVFRQQGDLKFIEMLNKMRLGKIDADTESEFRKLSRKLPDDEIIPAELYSTRTEVDRANNHRLSTLPGEMHDFKAVDGGDLKDKELRDKLLQNFLAPKELHLKVGAQVMMIKNIDATLVNGSLGKVLDFMDADTYFFYNIMCENPQITVNELENLKSDPLKIEELKEEAAAADEANGTKKNKLTREAFNRRELSHASKTLDGSIFDFLRDTEGSIPDEKVNLDRKKKWLDQIHESSNGRKLPLVRFKMSDMTTRTILVEPEDWAVEDEHEKPLVSRVQLPLMLAWSLSIHKSQGQTLPKVKVDLRRVFEKGQAYVALSRAVSREGLQVVNFDRTKILAHDKVIEFYKTLESTEAVLEKLGQDPPKKNVPAKAQFAPKSKSFPTVSKAKSTKDSIRNSGIVRLLQTRRERSKH